MAYHLGEGGARSVASPAVVIEALAHMSPGAAALHQFLPRLLVLDPCLNAATPLLLAAGVIQGGAELVGVLTCQTLCVVGVERGERSGFVSIVVGVWCAAAGCFVLLPQ